MKDQKKKMVTLFNRKKRTFTCENTNDLVDKKTVYRSNHDNQTGTKRLSYAEINIYGTIYIAPNQKATFDASVLELPGVKGALKEKWLRKVE